MAVQVQKPSKPFRFLDLPPEIREKIYTMIVTSPDSHIDLSSTYQSPHFPHTLLLTCTQIYHELRPLYFTANAFSITILRRNQSWIHLLTPCFLDNRRQIRSLRILIVRWGAKNFFSRSLVPALEDCILNGRLRELEVVIRDSSVNRVYMRTLRENENWALLRRLMLDPYLEKASLKRGKFSTGSNGKVRERWDGWDLEVCEDLSYLLDKPGINEGENLVTVI